MEKHRATIYPKFLECAEYTFDPFWQTLFHELAAGRCPRGCKLVRNQLYFHSSPRGVTSVELPQDPRELFLFTIDFFRERFRLVSKRDKKRVELDMDKARQELEDTYRLPWGQIKKKNVRTELFTEFLIQLGHKYQMSNNQLTQLENELQLAFERHVLLSSDVDYRNGRIYKIKGLSINKKTKGYTIHPQHTERSAPESNGSTIKRVRMPEVWSRYLAAYVRRVTALAAGKLTMSRFLV